MTGKKFQIPSAKNLKKKVNKRWELAELNLKLLL